MAEIRAGGTGLGEGMLSMLGEVRRRQPEMVLSARNNDIWRKVADPAAVSHTDAVYTVPETAGSQVVIYVDANIWATELGLQCELLRLKMNIAITGADGYSGQDPEPIKRLRFAASKEKYRGKRACDVPVEQQLLDEDMHFKGDPVALTPEEEADIERQVAGIEDPRIRRAALAAMRASAELRKGQEE